MSTVPGSPRPGARMDPEPHGGGEALWRCGRMGWRESIERSRIAAEIVEEKDATGCRPRSGSGRCAPFVSTPAAEEWDSAVGMGLPRFVQYLASRRLHMSCDDCISPC